MPDRSLAVELGRLEAGGARDWDTFGFRTRGLDYSVVSTEDVTGGMVTALPRQRIPLNSAYLIRNGRVRDYWCGRRPGTVTFLAPPGALTGDDRRVIRIMAFYAESGEVHIVVFRRTSAQHALSSDGWVELTGGSNFHADVPTRPQGAQLIGRLYVVNYENRIHEINLANSAMTEIVPTTANPERDGPRAKFVTTFAERIVVANIREFIGGERPTKLRWCKPLDPFDWTDETAGFEDLALSPSDLGDAITGIFGLEREMVILRERSIWHASRQPFAIAPFRFVPIISGMGCDLPYTAQRVEGGIIYADRRTQGVYFYQPGARPVRITRNVGNEILADLATMKWAEASDDPFNQEYHLGIATTTTGFLDKFWVYNRQNRAWSRDDSPEASALGTVETFIDRTMIDELTGFIDGLSGVIDDLSGDFIQGPLVFRGLESGEVIRFDETLDTDWDGTRFEFEFVSQNFGGVVRERSMQEVLAKVESSLASKVKLENSKDREEWRNARTHLIEPDETLTNVTIQNGEIQGTSLWWRMTSQVGDPRIVAWWAKILEAGMQTQ